MGTLRYGTFLIFTNVMSIMLEALFSPSLRDLDSPRYPGPYPLLGALFLLYRRHTPRLHPRFFGALGFDFSEKALTYAILFQVIFSGGVGTIFPALCGALSGGVAASTASLKTWGNQ